MNAPSAAGHLDPSNPWPGLRSFAEDDSDFFFGRERETRDLLEIVERSSVAVLYGQSGLGKTSLLRAGLFPLLKASGHVPVWVRLDYDRDVLSLARQVLDAMMAAFAEQGIEAPAPHVDESLWSYFHRADADFWGPRNRLVTPVIVLDQFEELFTLGQRDAQATQRTETFARELEAQLEQRPPAAVRQHLERFPEDASRYDLTRECVRFVISLREDFLPHLDAWRGRMPSMLARRYRLEPMSGEQALEVVEQAGGSLVDDAVAREIVAFVAVGGTRVEPAILSLVCDQLNLRRQTAGLLTITRELLSGERSRIIEDFYERSFVGIPEPVRAWVEDELLTASGHRDHAAIEDAYRAGVDPAPIALLVDRRILHSDERNQVVWVEFTHDLLTEPALASRTARQTRHAEEEASQREAVVREKLRRSRKLTAMFGAMSILMSVAAAFSLYEWNTARVLTKTAERATETAQKATEEAGKRRVEAVSRREESEESKRELAEKVVQLERSEKEAIDSRAEAQENLKTAQDTAGRLGEQAVGELRNEWLNPGYDSAKVVAANVLKIDTLAKDPQFQKVPMLRVHYQLGLSLAALVYADRGQEAECTKLAGKADEVAKAADAFTPQAIEASATTHLAAGQCLRLRGRPLEASKRLQQSTSAAQGLPPGSAERHRLLVLGALARGQAALDRYDFPSARAALQDTQALIRRPAAARSPDGYEAIAWKVAAASLEAGLASGDDGALAARKRAREPFEKEKRELASVLKLPSWRYRQLVVDQNLAYAESASGHYAAADDLAHSTQDGFEELITTDPENDEWQLARDRSRRLRAEILYVWGRRTDALKLIGEIDESSSLIKNKEPHWARARHLVAVSQWLNAKYDESNPANKAAMLQRAADLLNQLTRDAPHFALGVRDLGVVHATLGDLSANESQRKGLGASERNRLLEEAQRHYQAALATYRTLGHAAQHRDVADPAGYCEMQLGQLALARDQASVALPAFQRAEAFYRTVPVDDQNRTERAVSLAYPIRFISRSLRWMGQYEAAQENERRLLEMLGESRRRDPSDFRAIDSEAWVHRMTAVDLLRAGRLEEAMHSSTAAVLLLGGAPGQRMQGKGDAALKDVHDWVKQSLRPEVVKTESRDMLMALEKLEDTHNPDQENREQALREHETSAGTPGVPGNWEHFSKSRMGQPDLRLRPELDRLAKQGWDAVRARRLRLPFYGRDSYLLEVDVRRPDGTAGVASLVIDQEGRKLHITGERKAIQEYNAEHELVLRTEAQARLYLHFWVVAIEEARIVDHPGDLEWSPSERSDIRAKVERQIEPLEVAPMDNGDWVGAATVQFKNSLVRVKLTLNRSGVVGVPAEARMSDLSLLLVTHRYSAGVRVRDRSSIDLALAIRDKNWDRAAEVRQATIDRWSKDRKNELPNEYLAVSWYRLLASEPAEALEATDAGIAINAKYLPLQINRAHALLLLGREAEAMELYRAHVGERLPLSDRLWQEEVLNDLVEFDKAGLTDPRFSAVRALMSTASK